jgi:hypothetical protein
VPVPQSRYPLYRCWIRRFAAVRGTCIYIYIYIYIYVYAYVYTQTHTHTHTHTYALQQYCCSSWHLAQILKKSEPYDIYYTKSPTSVILRISALSSWRATLTHTRRVGAPHLHARTHTHAHTTHTCRVGAPHFLTHSHTHTHTHTHMSSWRAKLVQPSSPRALWDRSGRNSQKSGPSTCTMQQALWRVLFEKKRMDA